MENGNKKRVIIISATIVSIVVIGIVIFAFFLKGKKDHFSATKKDFFEHALMYMDKEDIIIKSVDAYYMDGNVYYHTFTSEKSIETGEFCDLELVYYGPEEYIRAMLNPNWEEKLDAEDDYREFLKAKIAGEHYKFSDEEIQKYMDEYYKKTR